MCTCLYAGETETAAEHAACYKWNDDGFERVQNLNVNTETRTLFCQHVKAFSTFKMGIVLIRCVGNALNC